MVIYAPDGEKWACEACLKGHRVTSCSHKERQLFHVNKKGRPVSQCQHCRGLRKSRHSHVKCVCAEYGLDKERSLERPFIGVQRCNCGQGMPCTCAVKREIDHDDLPKAAARNLTHRRVQSHGAKPVMPNRRSDSTIPRPQLGAHHPPLHRMNNAAHEFGMPYQIKNFTTSTPNISTLAQPSSEDNLQFASMHQSSRSVSHAGELSTSVPSSTWTPPQLSAHPYRSSSIEAYQPSFSSADLLQPRADTTAMNNQLSPGNPARYSMNDLSTLQWQESSSGGMYGNASFAASADQLGTSAYSDWGLDTPPYPQDNTASQTPQNRLSIASVEQPALTHSPSNTISEAGSSVYPSDSSYAHYGTQPPATINPSFTSQDYFGLDPVSENMSGDLHPESFAYRPEGAASMDDIFGAGPGPTEPIIKSEPEDYSMHESFATNEQYNSGSPGPSLVVPQFNTEMGTTSSYVQYPGVATRASQEQPQYFDQNMGGAFNWDMAQQQNMS